MKVESENEVQVLSVSKQQKMFSYGPNPHG